MFPRTVYFLGALFLVASVASIDEPLSQRDRMLLGVANAIDYRLNAMLELYSKNETEETVVEALRDMGLIVWDFDNIERRLNCTELMKDALEEYEHFCGNYVYLAHQTKIPIMGLGISKEAIFNHLQNWHTDNWDTLEQEQKNRHIIALFDGKMTIEEDTTTEEAKKETTIAPVEVVEAAVVATEETVAATAVLAEIQQKIQNATLVDQLQMPVITNSSGIV